LTTGSPVSWLWDFGDGVGTSTLQNPTYNYTESGRYVIKLRATDSAGNYSDYWRSVFVRFPAGPADETLLANFTPSPSYGDAPLDVNFTDESTGNPTQYYWSFGDGTYSAEQNPSHRYNFPGGYTVTLLIRDVTGATSIHAKLIVVTELGLSSSLCDTAATYELYPGAGFLSCATCCAALDAMAIGDLEVWSAGGMSGCLGVTAAEGVLTYDGKTFSVTSDAALNNGGSLNIHGAYIYDVVRLT